VLSVSFGYAFLTSPLLHSKALRVRGSDLGALLLHLSKVVLTLWLQAPILSPAGDGRSEKLTERPPKGKGTWLRCQSMMDQIRTKAIEHSIGQTNDQNRREASLDYSTSFAFFCERTLRASTSRTIDFIYSWKFIYLDSLQQRTLKRPVR
jgi:hypothetical protein